MYQSGQLHNFRDAGTTERQECYILGSYPLDIALNIEWLLAELVHAGQWHADLHTAADSDVVFGLQPVSRASQDCWVSHGRMLPC